MKVFSCSSLNPNCTWTMTGKTEELLLDRVSLHLRAAHDLPAITQETAGKIKILFSNPWLDDAAGAVDTIMNEYNCDREPRCTWEFIAQAESILTGDRSAHARELVSR